MSWIVFGSISKGHDQTQHKSRKGVNSQVTSQQNGPLKVGAGTAKFENVLVPVGLNIDEVHVDVRGLAWSTKTSEMPKLDEPGKFTVIVTSSSIASFLESIRPGGLQNFNVDIRSGAIHAAAVMRVIVPIQAKTVVELRIVDEKQLIVHLVSAEALGAGVKNLVQTQLSQLNPIFDASDLPVDVRFESVTHEAGQVRINGRVVF